MYGSKGLVKETSFSVCIFNRPLTNRLSAKLFLCYCHCIEEMICPFLYDDDANRQTFLLFSWRRSDCDWKRFCNYNEKLLDWEIAKRRRERRKRKQLPSNRALHWQTPQSLSHSVRPICMYVKTIWLIRFRITNMDGKKSIKVINRIQSSITLTQNS